MCDLICAPPPGLNSVLITEYTLVHLFHYVGLDQKHYYFLDLEAHLKFQLDFDGMTGFL